MAMELSQSRMLVALGLSLLLFGSLQAAPPAAAPNVAAILATFQPVQKDVQIDRPEGAEIAKCTISGGKTGYIIRDPNGQILRNFKDTNNDGVVDQWCYYKDGVEVYRDIDSNFNKKADQYRWLNTAGTRWGIDLNEDTKIDQWKVISAEEVTYELVAALRDRDRARFERLLLTAPEVKALGIGPAKGEQLQKKIAGAIASFGKFAGQQKLFTPETKWISFGGLQPGVVPAGTENSTADVVVYENVMAMIETDGKPSPITVGTLVRVKDVWRLIDAPHLSEDSASDGEPQSFFFAVQRSERPDQQQVGKPNEKTQSLMKELQDLGDITAATPAAKHDKRIQIYKALAEEAETPELRAGWYRQLADTLSTAVQTAGYEAGVEKLSELYEALKSEPKDEELAVYVQFRWMTSEHGQDLAKPDVNFAKIQEKWVEDLEKFVESSKKYPDSADAMMELAIAQEFGGDEEKALAWYDAIAKDYPTASVHRKALGAKLRLTCVGKPIPLQGKLLKNGQNFELSGLKGKVVLIQYWATWCEPCKSDLPLLKELRTKFQKDFEVVGVCLDNDKKEALDFLAENDPRWVQLFEEGGLDSRFANDLGIQNLPTMILIDKQGRVVNRNIRATELESELKKLLK